MDFILHHYAMSPFSEKIRSMLGYANSHWQSVQVRERLPRPHLLALAGGYRKVPVAQSGADIFCDTRIISTEIARQSGLPLLALENCDPALSEFVERVDLEIFLACIISAGNLVLLRKFWQNSDSFLDLPRFFLDRAAMARGATVKVGSPRKARHKVKAHLADLESRLVDSYLFGVEPSIADFSAWHSLWFIRDLAESAVVAAYPRVDGWMNRMQAFGHGQFEELSIDAALRTAREATPRPLPASRPHPLLGQDVSIAPNDYGRNRTVGTLVCFDGQRFILSRNTQEAGLLHVHFPVQGFSLASSHAGDSHN